MTTTTTATSRALHRLCLAARSVACGAPAGQPCLTSGGQEVYHLARCARTTRLITADCMAVAITAAGPVFTPASVITGGAS